jgi:hypothetical protein
VGDRSRVGHRRLTYLDGLFRHRSAGTAS